MKKMRLFLELYTTSHGGYKKVSVHISLVSLGDTLIKIKLLYLLYEFYCWSMFQIYSFVK